MKLIVEFVASLYYLEIIQNTFHSTGVISIYLTSVMFITHVIKLCSITRVFIKYFWLGLHLINSINTSMTLLSRYINTFAFENNRYTS